MPIVATERGQTLVVNPQHDTDAGQRSRAYKSSAAVLAGWVERICARRGSPGPAASWVSSLASCRPLRPPAFSTGLWTQPPHPTHPAAPPRHDTSLGKDGDRIE